MLELQLRELRDSIAPEQEVFIFLPTAPWRAKASVALQQYARALAEAGQVVLFDCSGTLSDGIGLREVEPGLFLYSGPTRHLAAMPDPILWVTIDNVLQRLRYPTACRVVYHWTETADVLRRTHEEAMDAANVVIASLPGAKPGAGVIAGGSEAEQVRECLFRLQRSAPLRRAA